MTVDELLERFELALPAEELPEVRRLLSEEVKKESAEQGQGDTELMKLLCVYLFANRDPGDSLAVWRAKTASMDADGSIEIQLLCGGGLDETKAYLASQNESDATAALRRIETCEQSGDFEGFSFDEQFGFYTEYYAEDEDYA